MIYRIILRNTCLPSWLHPFGNEFNDEMIKMGLKPPKKIINQRARFYFTERGWDVCGRHLVKIAKRRGLYPKVIKRKNPKRSDVCYFDSLQVALLPLKKK